MLYAVPALVCAHAACVTDPDVWWHLRSAEWMTVHHAIPHADPFTSYAQGKPWAAYSWLFELLVSQLFQRFGLMGIVLYSTMMVAATTFALHRFIRRLCPDFSIAVLLTLIAALSLGRLYTPRPWHFSILFFVLELHLLSRARRERQLAALAWLPVLFAFWANLHIQFVDGLVVLALASFEAVVRRGKQRPVPHIPAVLLLGTLTVSVLATCLNPYGWHLYQAAYELAAQPGVMDHVTELQAIPFRGLPDFGVLVLALGAAASFGWERRVGVFEGSIFGLACWLAFRSQRDVWVLVAVSSMVIASRLSQTPRASAPAQPSRASLSLAALTCVGTALLLWAGFRVLHVNNSRLADNLAKAMPVRAVEAVRAKGYAGPLYNDYAWGGYLMWSLRMPVSLDGRAALAGDERLDRSLATWSAEPSWRTDKELMAAGLVIGPVKAPLVQVLRLDPRFRLAYEDGVAAVFLAGKRQGSAAPSPSGSDHCGGFGAGVGGEPPPKRRLKKLRFGGGAFGSAEESLGSAEEPPLSIWSTIDWLD